ncbi:uncharacterized protein UTRI_05268_B [Ustilago trichophora]|uniref:Uncharacterized protein n=1 Tax=Ustilago trichophora TaxID=86804 RepID=A0A5C3ELW4_9BASI|nr:uncharacterized protein UTRI_05268_B [Ustilago trichophora]
MDNSNPYQLSPSISQSGSVTFDPNAVIPAFARTPSHHLPTVPPTEPSTSTTTNMTTDASRPRLSIPSLGDASLMGELPTTDPLSILVQKHLPPHLRPVRDLTGAWHAPSSLVDPIHSAPTNEIPDPFTTPYNSQQPPQQAITPDTVRQAASTNAWRKIASLARSQIESYSLTEQNRLYSSQQQQLVSLPQDANEPGMDVEEVLQWWSVRLYALARLRLYSMLRTELGGLWQILASTRVDEEVMLEDSEMVPFTLRVLRATEPKFRGDTRSTIEQYTVLIHMCKGHMKRLKAQVGKGVKVGEKVKVWKERAVRVGLMLAFTLAEAKDYSGAIELLEPLVEKALTKQGDKEKEKEEEGMEARVQLVVVASRIWIQAGDLSTARTLLDRISSLLTTPSPHIAHSQTLLSAIEGDFSPNPNPNPSIAEQLNIAIQTFYTAHLDDSILKLESVLNDTPAQIAAADAVLFNIATLYELAAGGEREVVERKRGLLEKTAKWTGEPGASGSWFKL